MTDNSTLQNWAGGEWMQYKNEAGEGAGHMSDVDVSAFDPIFYLHHWYLHCPDVRCNLILA